VRNYLADLLSKSRGKVAFLSQISGRSAAKKSVSTLPSCFGLPGVSVKTALLLEWRSAAAGLLFLGQRGCRFGYSCDLTC
jgi:hypothetical protein